MEPRPPDRSITLSFQCVDSCSRSEQHRRVYCVNNAGRRAAPRMCDAVQAPPSKRQCDVSKCPYEWVPGPWNTVSRLCNTSLKLA